eukprot:12893951-Prorocentrum_lima.AAC.1
MGNKGDGPEVSGVSSAQSDGSPMWPGRGKLLAGGASNDENKGSARRRPDDLLELRGFRLAQLPHISSQGVVSNLVAGEVIIPEPVCGSP